MDNKNQELELITILLYKRRWLTRTASSGERDVACGTKVAESLRESLNALGAGTRAKKATLRKSPQERCDRASGISWPVARFPSWI